MGGQYITLPKYLNKPYSWVSNKESTKENTDIHPVLADV
jgi:hypothetical protein